VLLHHFFCYSAHSTKVLTCHMPQQWQLLCFTASFLMGLTTLLHPILNSSLQSSSAPHLHQHPLTCLLQLCLELLPLIVQTAAVIL
jgi:hypothetical protein